MQAALDLELFAFAILGLPVGRPEAGGGGRVLQLRIFASSDLRRQPSARAVRQGNYADFSDTHRDMLTA
jgi:hypothetical protein